MKKRFTACCLMIALLTVFLQPFSLSAVGSEELASAAGQEQLVGKKTNYLAQKVSLASDEERIPVCVEFDGINDDEMYEVFAERYPQDCANYLLMQNGGGSDLTMEEVQSAISHKRQIYQQMYAQKNEESLRNFAKKLPASLAVKETAPVVTYISKFSPVCFLDMNKAQLEVLEATRGVNKIEYNYEVEISDEMPQYCQETRSKYIRDTFGNKGAGVGIGQIEIHLPNQSHTTELTGVAITKDPSGIQTESIHASAIAAILVGQVYGCAPDATLYSTAMDEYAQNFHDFYQRVEWLLAQTQPPVNVINMSAGMKQAATVSGGYDAVCQWVDHIAMQHDVHFVKSAGNNGGTYGDQTGRISSPGMAYNIVTVGAYKVNNKTITPYTDFVTTLSNLSSYVENAGLAQKPDLVAPGETVNVIGIDEMLMGTSLSAAMVSGIMAQLISCTPALAAQQRAMKAILLASAWDKLDSPAFVPLSGTSQMDDKQGVGKVDAKNARYTLSNGMYTQALVASTSFPYTKTVTFSSSASSARVALVWSKRNKITGSHTTGPILTNPTLSDLDLQVYAPNGTLVASSTQRRGNVEIVQFKPTVSGTYTIKVTRISGTESQDSIALAWW
nr:S8 family serine peptidase [bacterium]